MNEFYFSDFTHLQHFRAASLGNVLLNTDYAMTLGAPPSTLLKIIKEAPTKSHVSNHRITDAVPSGEVLTLEPCEIRI